VLVTGDGTQKLTELKWVNATIGRGEVSTEHSASGNEMRVAGKPVPFGIAAHAKSVIEFDVPVGATRYQCFAGIDDSGAPPSRGPFGPAVRFLVFTQSPYATEASSVVPATLTDLGFSQGARIRDLWDHKELGPFEKEFAPTIKAHSAGLYRVSPAN
jgi:hypothetical protein